MGLVELKSENKDLSYVIEKNPHTGLQVKKVRKGLSFGWFPEEMKYVIYFKDGDDEVSYSKSDGGFDYLDLMRYGSPVMILNLVNEYFKSTLNKQQSTEIECKNSFVMNMVEVKNKVRVDNILGYFSDIECSFESMGGDFYQVTISNNSNVRHLLKNVSVMLSVIMSYGYHNIYIDNLLAKKVFEYVAELDLPYYVRYVLVNRMVVSKEKFKDLEEVINRSDKWDLSIKYGHTQEQRREFVREQLSFDRSIVDIGCGEGFYALPFSKNLDEGKYIHAIDTDEEVLEKVYGKVNHRGIENISFYDSYDEYSFCNHRLAGIVSDPGNKDVLMVEVLEHMGIEAAGNLLTEVLSNKENKKVIITTPNRSFNRNYMMEGTRHVDHVWEKTASEIKRFVGKITEGMGFDVEYLGVGDAVDGEFVTLGVLIKRGI